MDKCAFVFPGQGSQVVGMGRDLYEKFDSARSRYEQAGQILGFDLKKICFDGPERELIQTKVTQPALFVHSVVLCELLAQRGVIPDMVAGHSLGEYSALASAGAFSFEQGLSLVKIRGELMFDAGKFQSGAMAAVIGLELNVVETICRDVGDIVQVANLNSATQIVISGSERGVESAMVLAEERGARRVIRLNVGGAFHSTLMESAMGDFQKALMDAEIKDARVPVYCNVTGSAVTGAAVIKELLTKQLVSPVMWLRSIENMIADGARTFYEVGPNKVLSGLIRRINGEVKTISIGGLQQLEN